MKILIIMPRLYPFTQKEDYNYQFQLGISYISSIVKKEGYDITCLNMNHYSGSIESILYNVVKNYDIVMSGNIWMGFKVMQEIVRVTRLYSKAKIILGGSMITSDPFNTMKILKPDYGIISEGENTIIELLKHIENPTELPKGVAYLENNEVKMTEARELIETLDDLPYPDFEGFEFERYLDNMYVNQWYWNNTTDYPRAYSIIGSRGCPFNCTFCYQSLGKKYRKRSVKSIIDEIKWAIEKYKINVINLMDDTFAIDQESLSEFADEIKKLNVRWCCQLSVMKVNDEILKKLKESGCDVISYGFESYSPIVLKSMKKPITSERIDFAIKETLKAGIGIQGNFIFGDPAETKETFEETLNYWKNNCEGQVNLFFVEPFAGSEIFKYCIDKGIIKDRVKYMSEDILHANFFNMTQMSDEEFKEITEIVFINQNLGYIKYSIPKEIKRNEKRLDRLDIKVDCPYCKNENNYKNFYSDRPLWRQKIMCRNCYYRFNILSPIFQNIDIQTGA